MYVYIHTYSHKHTSQRLALLRQYYRAKHALQRFQDEGHRSTFTLPLSRTRFLTQTHSLAHIFTLSHSLFLSRALSRLQNEGTMLTLSHAHSKLTGLFCKRALQKRRYSAKETYNLIDPLTHTLTLSLSLSH